MLHIPFSIHVCFPFGAVNSWFVSKMITRKDPRNFSSFLSKDEFLSLRTAIVIQVFHSLTKKARNKFLFFKTFDAHFCIHCVYAVKDIKEFVTISTSTAPRNAMHMITVPCCLFIGFVVFWWTKWNPCTLPSVKSPISFLFGLVLYQLQSKECCFRRWLNWKGKVETLLHKDKRLAQ